MLKFFKKKNIMIPTEIFSSEVQKKFLIYPYSNGNNSQYNILDSNIKML